jgi:23S rRNA pseudouridine1911/1915/1917 synthase
MASVPVKGGSPVTLSGWILEHFPRQKKLKEVPEEAGLIHRLDNDTSGVMVAARTDKDYKKLRESWKSKEVTKEYLSLVLGQAPEKGKISALIAHHPDKSKKMIVTENAEEGKRLKARFAETEYRMLESFLDYTYLKIKIREGLRHQIRCHMAHIGHPISGDQLYQKTKHRSRDWLELRRHFLHATELTFVHPSSGKTVRFEAPLAPDLQETLNSLREGG